MGRNQTSWKKGQSGNPNGAPLRDWTWATLLQEATEQKNKDGRSVKEIIAEKLVEQALSGNIRAMKELMNRMDGLPMQKIESDQKYVTIAFDSSLKQE